MNKGQNPIDEKFIPLLEQIKEMFLLFGLKTLSMDEISRKLGISKKTLYFYVKNKEDLIGQLFRHENQKWFESSEEIWRKPVNAIEKLLNISLMVHQEMGQLNPMVKQELEKYYEPAFEKFMEQKRDYIYERIVKNTEQGIAEKLYREDLNVDLVATIYINYFIEMHNTKVCEMHHISFEEVYKVMFENHIRGIATPEGVTYFETRKNEIVEYLNNLKQ